MGKTLFAISTAALMVAFVAGFAVADSQARHAPLTLAKPQPSPFQMMTNAKQMPAEHFADFTFVY